MAKDENAQEVQALRQQMQDAIKTIRKSKIGDQTGKAALYELPWYMVIGNPAAGKSSAVLHSGLKFPFMEQGNKLSVKASAVHVTAIGFFRLKVFCSTPQDVTPFMKKIAQNGCHF